MSVNLARSPMRVIVCLTLAALLAGCGSGGGSSSKKPVANTRSSPAPDVKHADAQTGTTKTTDGSVTGMPPDAGVDPGIVTASGGDDNSKKAGHVVASLTIVLVDVPHDSVPPRTIKLRCPDTTGDHEAACNALADHPEILDLPAGDTVCTELYGGPETAHVTGTFVGKPVKITFTRTNGCQIAAYKAAQVLWEATAPA